MTMQGSKKLKDCCSTEENSNTATATAPHHHNGQAHQHKNHEMPDMTIKIMDTKNMTMMTDITMAPENLKDGKATGHC